MQWLSDWTAAQRAVCSIPARNKYLYDLQVVVPGLGVCVCEFIMFVNAPTIQEKFLVWAIYFPVVYFGRLKPTTIYY